MTAELLKDIITIFYAPLATVYKAASIADSLGDLQNFMNDMIRTIEQVDESESLSSVCDHGLIISITAGSITYSSDLYRSRPTTRAGILYLCPQCPLERIWTV